MTEQIHDQVSAFVDDELSAEECAFFVRRLERDPEARGKAIRYMTLGAALRGELLQPDPGILQRRVQNAISGVQASVPQRRVREGVGTRVLKPVLGAGIAASVAVVALFALRVANDVNVEGGLGAEVQSLRAAQSTEAPSYVVPQEILRGRAVVPPIRLTNYLMHHGEYASGLNRTLVRSNVVSTREAEIAVGGEEAFE